MKVKVGECICCTNTNLFGKGETKSFHCGGKVGEPCSFCDGTFVRKKYIIDDKYLEIEESLE